MKLFPYLLALILVAVSAALGQNLPDLGDASQRELSALQERRLGERIMREIRADRTYSDDPEITDYLNALGNKLVVASPDTRQEFQFFLIMDPQINAFALPGGYVGVNSGLLLAAQTEAELAGVLSHEIGHVVQRHFARMLVAQRESFYVSLAALAVGILASRGNSDAAQAAIIGSQASHLQNTLNFSRAHEQEADRVGFQILEKAGYDPQGMAGFFDRLLRASRYYETTAPSYLRTHPLTTDRIADMQNRAQNLPYRQVPDSIEFQFMRAKLKAHQDSPQESVAFFQDSLKERKYLSEAATRYGLMIALTRARSYARARQEVQTLRKLVRSNAMVEAAEARLNVAAGEIPAALQIYREALKTYPEYRALTYEYADALLRSGQPQEALKVIEARLHTSPSDYQLYQLQAQSYAALNKLLPQHRALAESYYWRGNIPAAIEQLLIAQKVRDGDFYQQSSVDARLRQLRSLEEEMRRDARK